MAEEFTEYQKLLLDRYLEDSLTERERGILIGVGIGPKEFGFEDEMMDFLHNNPDATLQELDEYAKQFFPEIEIVDDDELDEEDRNPAVYED